jgi:hypothetical protein
MTGPTPTGHRPGNGIAERAISKGSVLDERLIAQAEAALLEVTVDLSALTGIWKTVYGRQDDLYAAQSAIAGKIWLEITAALDVAALVAAFRREAMMTSAGPAAGTDHPSPSAARHHKRELRNLARSMAAGLLIGVNDAPDYADLLSAITDALTLAAGEGFASALAVAAAEAGHAGFDWDAAVKDGRQEPGRSAVQAAAAAIIAGAVADLARKLVSLAVAGASEAEMVAALKAILVDARSLGVNLTHAMASAITAAMHAVYAAADVRLLDFLTAGDARVCPICEDLESHNPYGAEDFPAIPQHPLCRCVSVPAGNAAIPEHMYAAYLTAA